MGNGLLSRHTGEIMTGRGIALAITVDCGITAFAPLQAAKEAGLDVVVVDHHVAEPALPPAVALVTQALQVVREVQVARALLVVQVLQVARCACLHPILSTTISQTLIAAIIPRPPMTLLQVCR